MAKINRVIKILILSDFFLMGAWGLIMPVFAIFILQKIEGGDASVAGIAVGIYWISKSLIQVPIGRWLDKNHGEKDDFWAMILGMSLASLTPLGFIFASQPWHIYGLQFIQALGMAFTIPSWGGIFTRHIDKGKEAMTWGLESSSLGLGTGIAGIIGGLVAKVFGFTMLFIGVSILGFISTLLLFFIKREVVPKDKVFPVSKPH